MFSDGHALPTRTVNERDHRGVPVRIIERSDNLCAISHINLHSFTLIYARHGERLLTHGALNKSTFVRREIGAANVSQQQTITVCTRLVRLYVRNVRTRGPVYLYVYCSLYMSDFRVMA